MNEHTPEKIWFDPWRLKFVLRAIKKLEGALLEIKTVNSERHTLHYDRDALTWNVCYHMKAGGDFKETKRNLNKYLNRIDCIESIHIRHIGVGGIGDQETSDHV